MRISKMPFPKFNFKKSKQQYNVASKSVFVLTVELLDSAVLECTLSAESTGRDCMDNVCQRLGLQQPDLFGLKYVSRRSYPKIRWVDLDRPLKKQLDKYSVEPYLYLGVIFYVTDVSLLEDEVTRYHYFLQLKMDVVEGRLRCNYEQAIVLASYSLQAEFGDHDQEKHTAEYLKDFPLLPKPMISQFEDRLGALTDAVVTQHSSLAGIAQQLAEIYYIVGAQQLEGYGQECFLAKDDAGNEVLLGASLIGICVRKGNGQSPQFFKWNEITNLVNHKRYFGIECQHFEFSVQFVFDEPEAAKYVWKMCVLQHSFYKMHQSATESNELNITLSPPTPTIPDMDYMNRTPPGAGSIKHADIATFQRRSQNIPAKVELQAGHSSSKVSILSGAKSDHSISSYRVSSRREPAGVAVGGGSRLGKSSLGSQFLQSVSSLSGGTLPPLTGARSTNDLDQVGGVGVVPTYRPAPDYQTAVMSKYGGGVVPPPHLAQLYSSQPSLHPLMAPPPLDLTFPTTTRDHHFLSPEMVPAGFPLTTSHTYSTPELNTVDNTPAPLSVYAPPPPYPPPPFSSSTPDLASQTGLLGGQAVDRGEGRVGVGGSSPDLVSRRTLGAAAVRPGRHSQGEGGGGGTNPDIHRTYDNLTNYDRGGGTGESMNKFSQKAYSTHSTEELNAVYNLNTEDNSTQPHQLLNSRNESYNHNYLYDQQLPPHLPLHHQQHLPPHLPLHQLDTHHLSHPEESSEPIYQNQGQILAQQQEREVEEPIYQNLPLHEKLNLPVCEIERQTAESDGSESGSIHIDDTIDGVPLGEGGIIIDKSPFREEIPQAKDFSVNEHIVGVRPHLVSRLGLTNSREDVSQLSESSAQKKSHLRTSESPEKGKYFSEGEFVYSGRSEGSRGSEPRRKLEMRQYLEPAVQNNIKSLDESLINTVNSSSLAKGGNESFDKISSFPSDLSTSETQRKKSVSSLVSEETGLGSTQGRSKGRKRWGLNMTVKSGSLKSNKSEKSDGGSKSGDDSRHSSGRGMGAMMLANLHGLTRSRPDILAESFVNAFNSPTKIPRESIGSFLETKLAEGEVVREFEKIPKKKTSNCNTSIANLPENLPRNRFKDVVPYDENRVKILNDKDNKYGYVNASHISATVGESQRFYIAAQGPLPNTVHNFWSMVQECDVHLIVMLTEVSGANKSSACIPYWPQNDGSSLEIGDFTITKKFSSDSGSYCTTTLQLTHTPTKRVRRVWHLQYSGWQDHGCPEDVNQYLAFCEEMGALRRHTVHEVSAGKNSNTPVLVHCSAGVGRSGVTILADILLYCADHNIDIDIPKVMSHLRQQRMLMVQTVAQYKFVHTVLINYLGQSRLI